MTSVIILTSLPRIIWAAWHHAFCFALSASLWSPTRTLTPIHTDGLELHASQTPCYFSYLNFHFNYARLMPDNLAKHFIQILQIDGKSCILILLLACTFSSLLCVFAHLQTWFYSWTFGWWFAIHLKTEKRELSTIGQFFLPYYYLYLFLLFTKISS